jgi:hypothetical protein
LPAPRFASAARVFRAAPWGALLLGAALELGCSEQERPDRVADPDLDDARRVLSGSFSAPAADAGANRGVGGSGAAGSAGASSCSSGAAACAATAGAAGSSAGSASTGTVGGATSDSPVTLRQTYEAVCAASTVQWGFFTYGSTTPGDSSISFRVRTAPTETQLPDAEYIDLLTASAALGTELCTFTGPAPCPVDLFVVLGGAPRAHHPFSELQVVLNPASSDDRMPTVDEWQLNYSCTQNQ